MFSFFTDKKPNVIPVCSKIALFNGNEDAFFLRLQKILPDCLILPHIQLEKLLKVLNVEEKEEAYITTELQKHYIDYAVYDQDFNLICCMDLVDDDSTIESKKLIKKLLNDCSVQHFQFEKKRIPTLEQLLRILAPFTKLEAPKARTSIKSSVKALVDPHIIVKQESKASVHDLKIPEHGNTNALSIASIERIAKDGHIKKEYPHIWQKICLFAGDPTFLNGYLESLFIQNRPPHKRRGLPAHVASEVMAIQNENYRFLHSPSTRGRGNSAWEKSTNSR